MQVEVTVDGTTETVDVTFGSLRLSESCDVEDVLGPDGFAHYQSGNVTPKAIRAVLWAKLRRRFPDLDVADVDMELVDVEVDEPGPFDEQS